MSFSNVCSGTSLTCKTTGEKQKLHTLREVTITNKYKKLGVNEMSHNSVISYPINLQPGFVSLVRQILQCVCVCTVAYIVRTSIVFGVDAGLQVSHKHQKNNRITNKAYQIIVTKLLFSQNRAIKQEKQKY